MLFSNTVRAMLLLEFPVVFLSVTGVFGKLWIDSPSTFSMLSSDTVRVILLLDFLVVFLSVVSVLNKA